MVLGQQKVDSKRNEITAIPAIPAIAIVDKGGYVLALKGNQSRLAEEVKVLFYEPLPRGFEEQSSTEVVEAGHVRIETRRYRQILLGPGGLPAGEGWAGLKSVVEVTATRHDAVTHSTEKRHFISSRPLDVASVSKAVRGWGIENSLHWVLDVAYREDESRIRRGHGAEVLSVY
ncbi:MAG: ISAs1 family transposase [Proteobacteria bacterium]|nr:ISAs1 family transposase [Pseudomonadota bacterium]